MRRVERRREDVGAVSFLTLSGETRVDSVGSQSLRKVTAHEIVIDTLVAE